MDGGCFQHNSCIFDAIDLMATKNVDFERSRAFIEKWDLIIPLIDVGRGFRAFRKLLMVNGIKDGGCRAF